MKKLIRIHYTFFLVLPILYFLGFLKEYLLMFFILAIHELAHLLAMRTREIELSQIRIEPFGISIRLKHNFLREPHREIIMAMAGPGMNLFFAALFFFMKQKGISNPATDFFMRGNLSLGLFNLLPAFPLDGGRILKAWLSQKYGYLKSYRFVLILSRIIGLFLILFGGVILYQTGFNFSVCLIGCFLYFNVLIEKNHSYYYLVLELSEYKKKNKHLEKMPVCHLAVNKNFPVRKILKELSLNRYYLISVIHNGRQIAQFTEGQLMEGLIEKGSNVVISQLI